MEITEKGYGKNYKYDKLNDLKNLISFKTSLTHDPPPDEIRESLRGLLACADLFFKSCASVGKKTEQLPHIRLANRASAIGSLAPICFYKSCASA